MSLYLHYGSFQSSLVIPSFHHFHCFGTKNKIFILQQFNQLAMIIGTIKKAKFVNGTVNE